MGYRIWHIKLMDRATGKAISAAGGTAYISAGADDMAKATLYDPDNDFASLANPITPTRGALRFATADTTETVDIYCMAPGGQFVVQPDVTSGESEIWIDTHQTEFLLQIPFSTDDAAAATEIDTGFDLTTSMIVHPWGAGVMVKTLDATETIDVGILSTEAGGDADGFMDAVSVATAVWQAAAIGFDVGTNNTVVDLTGGDAEYTYGVFFVPTGTKVAKSEGGDAAATDGNGFAVLVDKVSDGTAKSISFTLSAGSDTAEGLIVLPYTLVA